MLGVLRRRTGRPLLRLSPFNQLLVSRLLSGDPPPRLYSYSRRWHNRDAMKKRVALALSSRGYDPAAFLCSPLHLDDTLLPRLLHDLFHATSDAALAFYFFRLSRRAGSCHGLRAISAMAHVAVAGNMNHIAVNCLLDLVAGPATGAGDEWHRSVFDALRETSRSGSVLGVVYSMLVKCYVDVGMADVAVASLRRMGSFGFFPSAGVYVRLLQLLLKSRQLETAWEVFAGMPSQLPSSNKVVVSLFIQEFSAHGEFGYACKLLLDVKSYGGEVDVVAFTVVIGALCKRGFLKVATSLLYKMIQIGVTPDRVSLSSIVDGYCSDGRLVEALSFFKILGCVPDEFMYNSFILRLCRDGNMEVANKLFVEMFEVGLNPDSFNYDTVIGGYCKLCLVNKAFKVLAQMLRRGHKPTVMTYTVLIESFCKSGDLKEAGRLLLAMRGEGLWPDVVTYNALLDGYSKKGQMREAYELKDMMTSNGVSPDVASYNILIDGLIRRGFLMESREIFNELVRRGICLDKFAFTNLIHGYCKVGNLEEAYHIWHRMSKSGMKYDVVTCSALLGGFCKAQRMQEAAFLFHKMLDAGLEPDLILYNDLIRGYCSGGAIDESVQLLNMMAEKGIYPNSSTYWAFVNGLEKIGVENAEESAAMKLEKIFLRNSIIC